VRSGPSSHRAAGLWLATSFTLDGGKAVSAMGFERGNEGFKTPERTRRLLKKMTAFQKAEALAVNVRSRQAARCG